VLRADLPDFRSDGACRAANLAGASFDDPDVPAPGMFFFYRVRAGNSCGEGPIGYGPGGVPEFSSVSCP
jgi:hypothetical protein